MTYNKVVLWKGDDMTYQVSTWQLLKQLVAMVICSILGVLCLATGFKALEIVRQLFYLGAGIFMVVVGILLVKDTYKNRSFRMSVASNGIHLNFGKGWVVFEWDFIRKIQLVRFSPRATWGYKLITVKVILHTPDGKYTLPVGLIGSQQRATMLDSLRQQANTHAIPVQEGDEG